MPRSPSKLILGSLISAVAGLMLIPAILDLVDRNNEWLVFMASAGAAFFIGGLLAFSGRFKGPAKLTLKGAFGLTVTCWVVIPALSALPMLAMGLSVTDAVFETMSGITTTGSTVLVGLDAMPRGILLWRSLLQWIGGVGIIVMAILLLPFLRIGGMQLFLIESHPASEKAAATTFGIVRSTISIYAGLTAICALLYGAQGMSAFDAICHAMTTLATGGFSTHDASFAYFDQPGLQWTATIFMLAGACPFVAYINMVRGKRNALYMHPEVRRLVLVLLATSISMALWLAYDTDTGLLEALRLTAFNITSIVTTTGYASSDYSMWVPHVAAVFFILTFCGGCTGSTSGGIKIFRFQILGMMMMRHLKVLSSPRRVITLNYQGKRVENTVIFSVVAFMSAFVATFAISAVALSVVGLDLVTALSGAATALANVGPGLGPIIGPVGNFAPLPDAAKWILSIAMLLGRLELLAVLVMLSPDFWR